MAKQYGNNKQTSSMTSGKQNFTKEIINNMPKDENKIMSKIIVIMRHGKTQGYKGSWTEHDFANSIEEFFIFCDDCDMKPTPPALRRWMNVSASQISEWKNNPARHGYKTEFIKEAYDIMEMFLQANIDKYPTGSIFLLKTSHGHIETSKVDVTTNDGNLNAEDRKELVDKMGFNKPRLVVGDE